MKQKISLNYHLLDWLTNVIKAVIDSTIEEDQDKLKIFISVNNVLNQIDENITTESIPYLVSEELVDKMLSEIKNII